MGKYAGITSKKMKDGSTSIMVRFKYQNRIYPLKNFTKLFNCKTQKSAFEKLQEVKQRIRENKDPFIIKGETLTDIFNDRIEHMYSSGDWRINTYNSYKYYYNSIIKQEIGHLKLHKITYEHLDKILKGDKLKDAKKSYKTRLKLTLNPVFREAMKKGHIHTNPCDNLETFGKDKMEKISTRVKTRDFVFLAREIYKSAMTYEERFKYRIKETQAYFTLAVMTAHRMGELIQLKREDVNVEQMIIKAPASITKTRIVYEFPLPEEVLEYVKSVKEGLLFPNINYKSQYKVFKQIVKNSDIELEESGKLTIHDLRRLMLNIMIINLGIDSTIADECLEHKEQRVIAHYLDITYETKAEAFYKYWDLLREKIN